MGRALCTEQLDELDHCVLLCVQCHKIQIVQRIAIDNVVATTTPVKGFPEHRSITEVGAIINYKELHFPANDPIEGIRGTGSVFYDST
jgi:hypothetical protein